MCDLPEINITDPYIRRCVEQVRVSRGVSTLSRATGQMLLERYAQIESDPQHPCPVCSSVTPAGENVTPET